MPAREGIRGGGVREEHAAQHAGLAHRHGHERGDRRRTRVQRRAQRPGRQVREERGAAGPGDVADDPLPEGVLGAAVGRRPRRGVRPPEQEALAVLGEEKERDAAGPEREGGQAEDPVEAVVDLDDGGHAARLPRLRREVALLRLAAVVAERAQPLGLAAQAPVLLDGPLEGGALAVPARECPGGDAASRASRALPAAATAGEPACAPAPPSARRPASSAADARRDRRRRPRAGEPGRGRRHRDGAGAEAKNGGERDEAGVRAQRSGGETRGRVHAADAEGQVAPVARRASPRARSRPPRRPPARRRGRPRPRRARARQRRRRAVSARRAARLPRAPPGAAPASAAPAAAGPGSPRVCGPMPRRVTPPRRGSARSSGGRAP